jgi:hypothetical protein
MIRDVARSPNALRTYCLVTAAYNVSTALYYYLCIHSVQYTVQRGENSEQDTRQRDNALGTKHTIHQNSNSGITSFEGRAEEQATSCPAPHLQ